MHKTQKNVPDAAVCDIENTFDARNALATAYSQLYPFILWDITVADGSYRCEASAGALSFEVSAPSLMLLACKINGQLTRVDSTAMRITSCTTLGNMCDNLAGMFKTLGLDATI